MSDETPAALLAEAENWRGQLGLTGGTVFFVRALAAALRAALAREQQMTTYRDTAQRQLNVIDQWLNDGEPYGRIERLNALKARAEAAERDRDALRAALAHEDTARAAIGRLTFGDYSTDAEKLAYSRAVLDCIAALAAAPYTSGLTDAEQAERDLDALRAALRDAAAALGGIQSGHVPESVRTALGVVEP